MIAQIAPLLRLPRSTGLFDYRCPDAPRFVLGQIVAVPFRKKTVPGIIIGLKKTTDVPQSKLREIVHAITNGPLLPESQLVVARILADENYASIATVMRSMLPDIAKSKLITVPRPQKRHYPSDVIRAFLSSAIKTADPGALITYSSFEKKIEFIRTISNRLLEYGSSTLILSPTIAAAETIGQNIPHASVLLHTKSVVERRNLIIRIRSQNAAIVVGTRTALLAPLQRLGAIIIDDEENDGHQQTEPNPRFDCRRSAAVLARMCRATLILLSRLPSLSAQRAITPTVHLDTPPKISHHYIDLEEQRRSGDYSILTAPALEKIRSTLAAHGKILIVHHHRSAYSSLECADCGYVPTCSICHVPYHQDGDRLTCNTCAVSSTIPVRCPRCNGLSFKGKGRGIQFIIRELVNAGIDEPDVTLDPADNRVQKRPITIITAAQIDTLMSSVFSTIVVTRFDSEFSVPRHDADERARRLLIALIAHCTEPGTLIVQASSYYRPIVQNPNDESWRDATYAARERFGFPPAWKLLLLRQRSGARNSMTPERLIRTIRSLSSSIQVTQPQRSRGRSRRDRGGTIIFIRYRSKLPQPVHRFLSLLDDNWTITINPVEIS